MTDESDEEKHGSRAYRYTTSLPETTIDTLAPADISRLPTSKCQHRGFLELAEFARAKWTHALLPVYTSRGQMTDVQTCVTEKVTTGDDTFVQAAQRGLAEELGCCAEHLDVISETRFVASSLRPFDPASDKFQCGSNIGHTVQVLPVGTYCDLFALLSSIEARSSTSSLKELRAISFIGIMPLDVLIDRATSLRRE